MKSWLATAAGREGRKHEEEVNLNMQLLRSQYEQAEIKLSAAQSALDESLRETGKFKKANEKLKRDNDEVVKLRGQIVELRRLVKTFDASNKKSKMKKERERERERGSGRNRASRGASDEETKELTVLVHRAAALEKKEKSFSATMRALLDIARNNVARSVPASITSATSPEYSRILTKLEKKVATAKVELEQAEATAQALYHAVGEQQGGAGSRGRHKVPMLPER